MSWLFKWQHDMLELYTIKKNAETWIILYEYGRGMAYSALKWRYMNFMASQITSKPTFCFNRVSLHQRKHKCSALPALYEVRQWSAAFPHQGAMMRKVCPCYDVIMDCRWVKQYGRIVRLYAPLGTELLMVADPAAIKRIFITNENNYKRTITSIQQ